MNNYLLVVALFLFVLFLKKKGWTKKRETANAITEKMGTLLLREKCKWVQTDNPLWGVSGYILETEKGTLISLPSEVNIPKDVSEQLKKIYPEGPVWGGETYVFYKLDASGKVYEIRIR
ncbi:MAG: hypothetical protein WC878_01255 [Candidatus Paceibacterota bacterium]|jgi:hypothetical protein